MTFTWEKVLKSFTAQAGTGETFKISIYHAVDDGSNTVQRIETSDGYLCDRIDDTTFKVVELDLIVKRV